MADLETEKARLAELSARARKCQDILTEKKMTLPKEIVTKVTQLGFEAASLTNTFFKNHPGQTVLDAETTKLVCDKMEQVVLLVEGYLGISSSGFKWPFTATQTAIGGAVAGGAIIVGILLFKD